MNFLGKLRIEERTKINRYHGFIKNSILFCCVLHTGMRIVICKSKLPLFVVAVYYTTKIIATISQNLY